MLDIVADDTDQPHTHRRQRVELRLVELAVKVLGCESRHMAFGARQHAFVVVEQGLGRRGAEGRDLLWRVSKAVLIGIGVHPKLIVPALSRPELCLIHNAGERDILHASEMPDEPGNRIAVRAGLAMKVFWIEILQRPLQKDVNSV